MTTLQWAALVIGTANIILGCVYLVRDNKSIAPGEWILIGLLILHIGAK
jgi:hypothetical protein